jgi:hypothetical protein
MNKYIHTVAIPNDILDIDVATFKYSLKISVILWLNESKIYDWDMWSNPHNDLRDKAEPIIGFTTVDEKMRFALRWL